MAEYIKRKEAENAIHEAFFVYGFAPQYFEAVHRLCEVASADVVEVVRCKDCAMANADSDERYMYCTKCHEYKPIDYYCAEGRRVDA